MYNLTMCAEHFCGDMHVVDVIILCTEKLYTAPHPSNGKLYFYPKMPLIKVFVRGF